MGKPQRRRKVHYGDTHLQRRWRVRSRHRDLDQVNRRLFARCDQIKTPSHNLIIFVW